MIRFFRAGAFASAAVLFACVSGTALYGAPALATDPQDQAANAPVAEPEASASAPRFVAEPVVQALPEQPSVDDADVAQAASLPALVATMGAGDMSPELTCLAQAVYFEARGEPLAGQLAVAQVIINRTESGSFPEDYCSVVVQRGQFSFVHGGQIPTAPAASPAWQRARAIARIAHQGLWDSGVGESLYFHNSSVRPGWSRRKATIARIDSHIFYR